jgi:outer membrane protein
MKKAVVFIAALVLCSTGMSAQKYGHLNFGNLIAAMPETEVADSQLEAYQKQLVAKGEEMAEAFQQEYGEFVQRVQAGEMPPKEQQERQEVLQQKQQEILQYEREVVQKVQEKRQELLEPIVKRAEEAIAQVAEENGYVMIFDTSSFNAVLFAEDSTDIMAAVKAKLGLE